MIDIGGRGIGEGEPCFIIAELGTSHLGSMQKARKLVEAAAEAGADCIKLQLVYAEEILHPLSGNVMLPTGKIELFGRFKDLELDLSFYRGVKEHVEKRGLVFLASAFGLRSASELKSLGVQAIKIASPELNHYPLLREVSSYNLPLILSAGVSTLADIERALAIVGTNVVLLHCITAYPAPEDEYNTRVLGSLRAVFGVAVGISDHSLDPILVPSLSVLNGACVVEKHFTLSRAGTGLDDPIALEPDAFASMVRGIRHAERDPADARWVLVSAYGEDRVRRVEGSGVKKLALSETGNYTRTNRSIHALAEIPRETIITRDMVCVLRTEKNLRPGIGPEFLGSVIGSRAQRNIPAGEGVEWADIIAKAP
jgi:sialic acid synthase SpsE